MAAAKPFRAGPIALSATLTTNILNPAAASGGVNADASGQFILIRQLHVVNKTGSSATFSLWVGATGANTAGTELFNGQTISANSEQDFYFSPGLRLTTSDFLVGGASAGTTLSITITGETGVA